MYLNLNLNLNLNLKRPWNCKTQEDPWKDLEFWREKLDFRWKHDPRVEQRGSLSKIFGDERMEARAGRARAQGFSIDAKAAGCVGGLEWIQDCGHRSRDAWTCIMALRRLSKASNWRWKWQEGHEVFLRFAWVLPEDSRSTDCMNHWRNVALLTRLSGLKNTKISSLVDHRDRRSPTTELKNLNVLVMVVVMKKFSRVSPVKQKFSKTSAKGTENSWTFRSADGALPACVQDRVIGRSRWKCAYYLSRSFGTFRDDFSLALAWRRSHHVCDCAKTKIELTPGVKPLSQFKGTPPRSAILITVVWPSRAVFGLIVFISLFRQDSCPSSLLLCLIVFLWCQCFVFVGFLLPNVWEKWDCDLSRRRCR